MAHTQSWAFPGLFDVARNRVSVLDDTASVANRSRLLILTEPTELYNSPDFGVGLKRHLFQYNNENQKAIIKDRIVEQLERHEPFVDAKSTEFADGLLFSGSSSEDQSAQEYNRLKMTVSLSCVFGDTAEVKLNNE